MLILVSYLLYSKNTIIKKIVNWAAIKWQTHSLRNSKIELTLLPNHQSLCSELPRKEPNQPKWLVTILVLLTLSEGFIDFIKICHQI